MASRRHLRKEEEEELKRRKKELKKSYDKARPTSKTVGSKRFSDTQKYLIIGTVAAIIIIVVAANFMIQPARICRFFEGDYLYASLSQQDQKIYFSRIIAYYSIVPEHTTVNCDIVDYFNSSFNLTPPTYPLNDVYSSNINYHLADVILPIHWSTVMENGSALSMSPWINKTEFTTTPSSIPRNSNTPVTFRLAIRTQIQVDRFNASLKFNRNIPNTTLTFVSISSGSESFNTNGIIFTSGTNLPANSTILLNFILKVNSSQPIKLNLIESGSIYLVKNGLLLGSFAGATAFAESQVFFSGYGLEPEPTLEKTRALNIIVNVPYYNITVT